jgi:hypothetical protein
VCDECGVRSRCAGLLYGVGRGRAEVSEPLPARRTGAPIGSNPDRHYLWSLVTPTCDLLGMNDSRFLRLRGLVVLPNGDDRGLVRPNTRDPRGSCHPRGRRADQEGISVDRFRPSGRTEDPARATLAKQECQAAGLDNLKPCLLIKKGPFCRR